MKVIAFFQRLVEAFKHVKSGGKTTRVKARKQAARPFRRCETCHQQVPHSADYRDHLH